MLSDTIESVIRLLDTAPDVWAVTLTAREADRNKYLLVDITRSADSGRISRPSSKDPGITIKMWERAPNIHHTIESDWITEHEVNIMVRSLAKHYGAMDIKRTYDHDFAETRWIFKPVKLWTKI